MALSSALGRGADAGKREGTGQSGGQGGANRQEKGAPEAQPGPSVLAAGHLGTGKVLRADQPTLTRADGTMVTANGTAARYSSSPVTWAVCS